LLYVGSADYSFSHCSCIFCIQPANLPYARVYKQETCHFFYPGPALANGYATSSAVVCIDIGLAGAANEWQVPATVAILRARLCRNAFLKARFSSISMRIKAYQGFSRNENKKKRHLIDSSRHF